MWRPDISYCSKAAITSAGRWSQPQSHSDTSAASCKWLQKDTHTHTHTHRHRVTVNGGSAIHAIQIWTAAKCNVANCYWRHYVIQRRRAMSLKWCVYVSVCVYVHVDRLSPKRQWSALPLSIFIHTDDVIQRHQFASRESECTVHLAASELTAENYILSLSLSLSLSLRF